LDFEKETIIRREINPQGKSRAFINDTPVGLNIIKELSEQLLDIHSQNATLLLKEKDFIFDIVDSQIPTQTLRANYSDLYKRFKGLSQQLKALIEQENKSQSDKSYYEYLLAEIDPINIDKAIENDLETEYNLLSNAEEVKSSLHSSLNSLNDDHNGILSQLQITLNELSNIKELSKEFGEIYERLNSTWIELRDIENEIARMEDGVELDNKRLSILETELSVINGLLKKHNLADLAELKNKQQELQTQLDNIGSISSLIKTTEKEIDATKKELLKFANQLTKERNQIIPTLEKEAKNLLSKMKMKNAEIRFQMTSTDDFNNFGVDDLELMAKTNLGSEFEPLKKVASGGESSRIMLAIKSLQTQSKSLPTIIFDEIDTGVSGEVATHMGEIMSTLGNRMQVISITHLPQIASKGKYHYKVFKEETNNSTLTKIISLSPNERVTEIAHMLSSNEITSASIENAKELLSN
jgi:DNA repair protein RecN (Recombination protein N)